MNAIAQVLYEAAAEVDRWGVCRVPRFGRAETCAVIALDDRSNRRALYRRLLMVPFVPKRHAHIDDPCPIAEWNDAQPSPAVVAAEMRSAAQLAELIGWRL